MKTAVVGLLVMVVVRAGAFEKIALVDSYDFATCFDVETEVGNVRIVDHVLRTGADTVLWRNCSGALPRYHSAEERTVTTEQPLEKLRLPDATRDFGWLRLDRAEPDILRTAMQTIVLRGKTGGVHWPYEEAHWLGWTLGAWNLAHPQYWCVSLSGMPFCGRASLVHPEVADHKLRLLDELLDRGAEIIYIDLMRNGGWSPAFEYTQATITRWRTKYGSEPVPQDSRDPRWTALVAEYQHGFFRLIRSRLDKERRKVRFILGIDRVGRKTDFNWTDRAIDWRKLARERTIDAVSVMSVDSSAVDTKDPWGATRRVYEELMRQAGETPVYFPVMAYDFPGRPGFPSYAKWSGVSAPKAVRRLLELARDVGGAGVTMECVDYGNYPEPVAKVIREFRP